MSNLSLFENIISQFDAALRTLSPPSQRTTLRASPGESMNEPVLSEQEKRHVAGLMRVNHAGEVCAQALYQGQALTAQLVKVRTQMEQAAIEEIDHLAWCEKRLDELGSKPSVINPFWYFSSFALGAFAGIAGDRFSLGFVAETELQVTAHLQSHINKLPLQDKKSKVILEQMREDEEHHASMAKDAGAVELPWIIKKMMQSVAKLMTHSSYYI